MSVKLILKNSKVQFKNATSSQLANAELAINFHESGPYLQAKGEDGTVHAMGGVYVSGDAPSNPLSGRWWYDNSNDLLFLYDGTTWQNISGSGGGGGGSTTVIGADGISATTSGETVTVSVDLAADSNGLSIASGKLQADLATESSAGTVIIGDGLSINGLGVLSADGGAAGDVNPLAGRALSYDTSTTPDTLNADIATASALGVIKVGDGIDVDAAGEISVSFPPSETYIGETPPASPVEGDLWWNSSDDSGRLYVYYEDANSSQWVEASPQGDTLTEGEADGLYLSKVNNDTAAGELTFEGETTHEAGVSVTGGSSETLKISSNGTSSISINDTNKVIHNDATDASVAHSFATTRLDNAGASAISVRSLLNLNYQNRNRVVGFQSTTNQDIRSSQFDLFSAEVTTAQTLANNTLAGFRSGINTSDNTGSNAESYNFFASGNAPNYFRGFVAVGTDPELVPANATSGTGLQVRPEAIVMARQSNVNTDPLMLLNRISTASNANYIHFNLNGVKIDDIREDGAGGVAFGSTSDYRTKENIVELPSAVDQIKTLRPINFNYTWAEGKTRPGFIAHELADVLPVAVTGTKDATEAIGTLTDYDGTELQTAVTEPSAEELEYTEEIEGPGGRSVAITRTKTWTPTGTRPVYQGVDQTKLIPLLTKALQEALERIEALEAAEAGDAVKGTTRKKK